MTPLTLLLSLVPAADPGPTEAERAALRSRQAIRTLTCRVARSNEDFDQPLLTRTCETRFWLDGPRLRVDLVDNFPGLKEFAGKRQVQCIGCQQAGYRFSYPEVDRFAAHLTPDSRSRQVGESQSFDPRLIGFVLDSFPDLGGSALDGFVGRVPREQASGGRELLDGALCDVVRFVSKGPTGHPFKLSLWIDPKRGHQLVKGVLSEGDDAAPSYRRVLTCDPVRVPKDAWFPKTVRFQVYYGSRLAADERLTISEVAINEPVPASAFTFTGIGVRKNTVISVADKPRGSLVWTGSEVVPYDAAKKEWDKANPTPPPEPVPLDPPARPQYWLYAVGGALGVAAVLLLWRAARRAT